MRAYGMPFEYFWHMDAERVHELMCLEAFHFAKLDAAKAGVRL